MLLNKIPVLDKGYVALLDSSMTTSKLREVGAEFYGGEYPVALQSLGTLTIAIKCPLFYQLYLSKFNVRIIDANNKNEDSVVDAFLPTGSEIGCRERLDGEAIADDISRTTNALLVNPSAYQSDGADRFISQIITPLNVYTTLIVQASYDEWCNLACRQQAKLPTSITMYNTAIEQIISVEWK